MYNRLILSAVPAAMMAYASFMMPIALANAPSASVDSGSPIWTALQETKAFPDPYPGPRATEPMEGNVLARFHVGDDGHPQNIDILQSAHHAALDDQTRKSIEKVTCPDCAGQDYLVTFRYRQE
ncbi:MAG TPA: TonB family protein [Aliidongia sp.]|nr:TonB family protein [Aliidongia sp.]